MNSVASPGSILEHVSVYLCYMYIITLHTSSFIIAKQSATILLTTTSLCKKIATLSHI